jgi:hypothetical protein
VEYLERNMPIRACLGVLFVCKLKFERLLYPVASGFSCSARQFSLTTAGLLAFIQGGSMGVSEILASVDREIALLKQVRALLSGSAAAAPKKADRRKKTVAVVTPAAQIPAKKITKKRKKRHLSPEGRRRIAEAVRRRWEAQRKAAASK